MRRKILIVDDNIINRELLKKCLCNDYDTIEAENGREALALMHRHYKMLSAVLLDIVMPEMDGYEVLKNVRENPQLAQIPVIVVTGSEDESSRVKALSYGANDFILKPFNPEIVKHCLRNNIALRETASILNAIQKDKLTGLYNREAFFDRVSGMTADREPGFYVLSCFDIDNFKLINDQFGAAEGDRILRKVGATAKEEMDKIGGVAGRISADNFAVLYPASHQDLDLSRLIKSRDLVLLEQQAVVFSIGRYVVSDLSLSASAIYDRAYIAKQSVKGRYDKHLAYFDTAMLDRLVLNQQITSEMETAIAKDQFEVWFQPQYDHASGALIGAEALARWNHPQKGIVAPGDFIPLFEQTGFVYELDKYVWAEVCRYLRKWTDEGRRPLPVSVNVSRYDIFRSDLIETITGITDKYGVPADMLRLEITESAFSSSTELIVGIVKQLIALGFTIEIDDFGSGYSSLNTLKDVPAQVVKLDMRFLEGGDGYGRGGNILESIVRMTKWLGMTVLAEGVEEKDQADFLKSIGCTYVQGYLYARPMPAQDYEALCGDASTGVHPDVLEPTGVIGGNSFWDPKGIDTLIFNGYVGGACVYEYCDGHIELIRVTDKYVHMVFGPAMSAKDALDINWEKHISEETAAAFREAMERSIEQNDEVSGEYMFTGLPGCPRETYLRTSLRVIASAGDHHLVFCISDNITAQRLAERAEHEELCRQLAATKEAELKSAVSAEQMQAILENVPSGVVATALHADSTELIFANEQFFDIIGFTREQFIEMPGPVYADDRELLLSKMEEARATNAPVVVEYRIARSDGRQVRVRHRISMIRFANMDVPIRLSVLADITAQHEALEQLRMSEEVNRLAIAHSKNVVCRYDVAAQTLYVSPNVDSRYEVGTVITDVPYGQVKCGNVSPETAGIYTSFYESIRRGEATGTMAYQRKSNVGWRWLEAHFSTIFSDDGLPVSAVVSYIDITDDLEKEAAYRKWQQSLRYRDVNTYTLYRCIIGSETTFDTVEGSLLGVKFKPGPFNFNEHTAQYAAQLVASEDAERFRAFLNFEALLANYYKGKRTTALEYREKLPQGGFRWLRLSADLIDSPHLEAIEAYLLFEDIDKAKRAELATKERAETDPLTGVLNRTAFAEKVDAILRASGPGTHHALLMLDVDGFKLVNDVFGHSAGDQALIDISELLRQVLRRNDLVGRLGGDEFVVFLPDIPGDGIAADKARQICEVSRKSFSLEVQISASVGIAVWPRDGADFEALYKRADETLYYVKGTGRNNYAFYHAEMETEVVNTEKQEDGRPHSRTGKKKRRMLIVDDSSLDCELLANTFKDDFIVEKAADGGTALMRLRHYGSAISVVLLDLIMPGMDGFAVLEKMQQSPELASIPVIVVSGDNDRETNLLAIRSGAADFITKPADPEILRIRVQSAISKAENERLRAQNSFLELQTNETARYRTILERTGTVVMELDWGRGAFTYSPSASEYIAGRFDDRTLWRILLSDMVTDAKTVKKMQEFVHDIAQDRLRTGGDMTVPLKTPGGGTRMFCMRVYKQANEYGLTDKLILTFNAVGEGEPA